MQGIGPSRSYTVSLDGSKKKLNYVKGGKEKAKLRHKQMDNAKNELKLENLAKSKLKSQQEREVKNQNMKELAQQNDDYLRNQLGIDEEKETPSNYKSYKAMQIDDSIPNRSEDDLYSELLKPNKK